MVREGKYIGTARTKRMQKRILHATPRAGKSLLVNAQAMALKSLRVLIDTMNEATVANAAGRKSEAAELSLAGKLLADVFDDVYVMEALRAFGWLHQDDRDRDDLDADQLRESMESEDGDDAA